MGMLEAAQHYVGQGYSVIPLRKYDKRPALLSWDEYQYRKPTEDELKAWFSGDEHNIAIVTGHVSGVFAVDVDTYKGTDHEPYPTGMVSLSAHGGKHYFYRLDEHDVIQNKQNVLPHVDVRGEGGYVAVYPSKLLGDGGEVLNYAWVSQDAPVLMPHDMIETYQTKRVKTEYEDTNDPSLSLLKEVLLKGYTAGEHNEQLHNLSRLLARASHNPALGKQVSETLLQYFESKDPTPQEGFEATFESGWDYEANRLTQKTAPEDTGLVREIRPVSLKEMRNFKPPEVIFEDGQVIREGTLVLVVGQRNNGKTLFLQHIGLGTAANGYKVCYVMTEDSPYFFAKRVDHWEDLHGVTTNEENFIPWRAQKGPIWQLTNQDDVYDLIADMKSYKPDLVILDPLIEFALGADEQSAQTMGLIMSHIQLIKKELNCTVVVSHHAGKDIARGARGSSAIEGSADTVILIKQEDSTSDVVATCTKERNGSKARPSVYKLSVSEDELGAALELAESFESIILADNDNDNQILRALLEAGTAMTPSEIAEATELVPSTVYRRLPILEKSGRIIKHERKYSYNNDHWPELGDS